MKTLFLDLASNQGTLACVDDQRTVAFHPIDHRVDDAALVPQVESVLQKAGWSYQDLTQIACVTGPGGFTSLRVAVALANALAHELNILACGIHLSDVYELGIKNKELRAVWIHSTKKTAVFIRDLDSPDSESRLVTLEELGSIIKKKMLWTGELIPEHRKILDDAGAEEAPFKKLEEVLPEFLKKQKYKKKIIQPWYGRGW